MLPIAIELGKLETIVATQLQTTYFLANGVTRDLTSKSDEDKSLLPVAMIFKLVSQLTELGFYLLITIPAKEDDIVQGLTRAARFCQAIQLMILSLKNIMDNKTEDSRDAAALALQQLEEIGLTK